MTSLTLSGGNAGSSVFAGFARTLGNFFAGAREGQDIARRYERLSRMSDGQLASLSLSRDQVPGSGEGLLSFDSV